MDTPEELRTVFHHLSAHMAGQINGTEVQLGWNEVCIEVDETGQDKVTIYVDPDETAEDRIQQSEDLFRRMRVAPQVSSVRFVVAEPAELQ